ncbi:MAG TPA: type II toxin-antitoxin system HicA family toxin [Lacipirellulaceae bacterium]|jgi:predicted RNA binding protein YcfA (HicA-like mRNA interferase family)
MGRLSGFKYKEVARKLRKLGFEFVRQGAGSHEIWRHVTTQRKITIAFHARDMPEGTLRKILREAEVDVEEFLRA